MKRCATSISVLLLIGGCTPQVQYLGEIPRSLAYDEAFRQNTAEMVAGSDTCSIWLFQGKYYVLGTTEATLLLKNGAPPPQLKSVTGLGPHGETVEFEENPVDPQMGQRLEEQFQATPIPLQQFEREYYVWKYDGRIFVIGDPDTNTLFAATKVLPLTKTFFAAGPNGETVIVEAKNGKPDFTERLVERFLTSPHLVNHDTDYFVWRYKDRLYVIGSSGTSLFFERKLFIPQSQAFLGVGPKGETVIFEAGKDRNLLNRLQEKFFNRTPPAPS
jgi:hypothetical protein